MLTSARTILVSDKAAIKQNLLLLLESKKNELYGDPYIGTELQKYLFEQNNIILEHIIKDELYIAIQHFIPQVFITRDNITISRTKEKMSIEIRVIYKIDETTDILSIDLMSQG